jgi:hypothetical protein
MVIPSLRDKVRPEQWQLRVDLAAAYRLVALYGWSDLVFTHTSQQSAFVWPALIRKLDRTNQSYKT